jgi:ATP-dependent RNA helicase DDX31/DBP7
LDHNPGRGANTVAIVSGKLPPGSIKIGGSRDTAIQEETRPAFVSGKLPPGSIKIGGNRSTVFQEETRPAFVSGKLPPGSINIDNAGKRKTLFQEETRWEWKARTSHFVLVLVQSLFEDQI